MTGRRGPPGATPTEPETARHIPVLLSEVIESLGAAGRRSLTSMATFGAGGYSRALLKAADCSVLALDRDPNAILGGKALANEFGDRLTLARIAFSRFGARQPSSRASPRSTASCSTSASPPCSSTSRSAASPSKPTARSTCACRRTGRARPTSSTARRRRGARATSSMSSARSADRARSRGRS